MCDQQCSNLFENPARSIIFSLCSAHIVNIVNVVNVVFRMYVNTLLTPLKCQACLYFLS